MWGGKMANNIVFKDYVPEINRKLQQAAENWLEEASSELESQVMRNTRVDTGRTKASFTHSVEGGNLVATVGSDYQNAIWEEYGTGVYAEKGGRKKVPWFYKGDDGKGHLTKGKRGTKAFRNAYVTMKPKLIRQAQKIFTSALKGGSN